MKKYIKSFFSFSLGTWFKAIISFVATPIISYLIAPEEMGKVSMFYVIFNIFNIFVFLGTDQFFVRFFNEYEKEKRNELLWNCLLPTLINGTIISMIILLLGEKISKLLYGDVYPYINLLLVITVFVSIFQLFNQYTILMEGNGLLYSLINVVNALANMLSTIILAFVMNKSFYALVLGNLIGYLAALLTGIFKNTHYWKPTSVKLEDVKRAVTFGLPFVPTFLVHWAYSSIDRISLRQFSTLEEIGLYSAAFKLVSIINLIQGGFSTFWTSTAYKRYEENKDDRSFFNKAHDIVSFSMFLVALLVLGFKDVIFLILAKSYRQSAYIAPFLVFMPILYSISETVVVGINFTKKTYWHFVISVFCALTNFVGNSLLVPRFNAKGAAFSTGMSYILFYILRMSISERLFPVGFQKKKPLVGILVMSVVAAIGTVNSNFLLNILAALIGIILVILVYRKESVLLLYEFRKTVISHRKIKQ
jgi:O-antigen/teichoic acid export membrane protein